METARKDSSSPTSRAENLKDVHCPRCGWRLMRAAAEGVIEAKCKDCKKIVRVVLKR